MLVSESKALVQGNCLHCFFKLLGGLVALRLNVRDLLVQAVQSIFLRVQLPCVALHKRLFLCTTLQCFHVLAYPFLIFGDGLDFIVASLDFSIQAAYMSLLVQHTVQSLLQRRSDAVFGRII